MSDSSRDPSFKRAVIGFALVAPAAYFIAAAVLKHGLGIGFFFGPVEALAASPDKWRVFNLVSPVVFMGGSLAAVLLNALQVVRLAARTEHGSLSGTVTVLRKPWNLAAVGLGLLAIFLMSAYVVAENWRCWAGLRMHC